MKKIYLLLLVASFGIEAMAQTFVSTTAENKNAVLEEYTGIYCTWCPDGHKRAQELKNANPSDVVLINVHQGNSFAAPRANSGDPDFRTQYGDALAGLAKVNAYPAGTVNRRVFDASENGGTTMNRGAWAASAATVIGESSPVNVAVETELNMETRELKIIAEVYYTANAANSTNKLNLALLQNNIEGPQTGMDKYAENILPNGKYNHQHMLRDLITGQWGEDIPETTSGSFFTKTYTYTIPQDINGVPVDLLNLEIAAFIAEGQENILTGITHTVLVPENIRADLATSEASEKENGICATSITPKLNVTNEGKNTVESFDVTATINGTDYKKSFSGSLATGESTTIEWDALNLPGGTYSLAFSKPSNINDDELVDQNTSNSDAITVNGYSFVDNAITGPHELTFNDGQLPKNVGLDLSQNDRMGLYYNQTYPYGAKYSYGAAYFYCYGSYNVAGKPVSMLMGKTDLSTMSSPYVTYWYAYSQDGRNGTNPTIDIQVSNDCGENWKSVGTTEATETGRPTQQGGAYMPSSTEYRRVVVSLDEFTDDNVIIKVVVTPGTDGNILWIDEVNLISDATSVNEIDGINSFSVYPNPVKDQANISFELVETKDIEINVYDALGRVVKTINNTEYAVGMHNVNITTADLENGIYILKAESNGELLTTETIIKE
jgi:hypothetical protein